MADNDLQIGFGGDISQLTAAVDQADDTLARIASSAEQSSSASADAFARLDSQLKTVNSTLAQTSLSTSSNAAFSFVVNSLHAADDAAAKLFGTVAAGAESFLSYAQSVAYLSTNLLNLRVAQEGLVPAIGRAVQSWQDSSRQADIYESNVSRAAAASIAAAGNMRQFATAARPDEGTENYINRLIAGLMQIPRITNQAAAGVVATLGSINNFSSQSNDALVQLIGVMARSGDDAQKLATQLAQAMSNPAQNGRAFLATLGNIGDEYQQNFARAQQSLSVNQMQAALIDAVAEKYRNMAAEEVRAIHERYDGMANQNVITRLVNMGYEEQLKHASAITEEAAKTSTQLEGVASALRTDVATTDQFAAALRGVLATINPIAGQLQTVQSRIDILNKALEQNPGNEQALQAKRTELDLQQQLMDKQAGGNVVEKAQADIAARRAAGVRDEIRDQQELAKAKQQQADATSDAALKTQRQTAADEAQASLQDKITAAGKTAAQEAAAEKASLEEANYQNTVKTLQAESTDIKAAADERRITRQQELAQIESNLSQQEAAERAHWRQLESIWGAGASQYREAATKLAQVDKDFALQRAQAEREVNKQIFNDYKSTYEQIGSSVTSSIMGMIQGQSTLRDAARSLAMSMVQMFIEAKVKSVADYLAGTATEVASHAAGEAAKTSATATGVAARSGIEAEGAAAQAATKLTSIVSSIMASASETCAGVFGFLSPVMGPAAAGPAVAAESSVAAVASGLSLSVGAWNLPTDTPAFLHAGEMVVPREPAETFRQAMGGGGQGGGRTFAPVFNGVQDARSAARSLAKLLNRSPSLRGAW